MEQTLRGIPVCPGIAIGQVFLLDAEGVRIPEHFIAETQVEEELERLDVALQACDDELQDLAQQVAETAGRSVAEIFTAHAGILRDESFREEIKDRIRNKKYTAEFAVSRTMRHWREVFQEEPGSLLASRVADMDDLERRLLHQLLGEKREELDSLETEVILVAHDLGPSETASIDPETVKAFATDGGGPTSHTAIIARALGIPAVVGLETVTNSVGGGDLVIVDGSRGIVIVDPDEETEENYRERMNQAQATGEMILSQVKDLPSETTDGRAIDLFVNIDSPKEIPHALEYGAEGVGLYRTEYLFLTSEQRPTEEDHYRNYMTALENLDGRPLTIRTLDLGADKFSPDMGQSENNPFLGRRSIRYCLAEPELLRTQLRAILRAGASGPVKVMFPLISTLDELVQAKQILKETREELAEEGIEYDDDMPVGIMIEVPSAAICADCLARQVDFFSIGTNDLIQYTLAIDRANEHVAHLYRPSHPAVVRLMQMSIEAARRAGIEVGLCGEMASEPVYTMLLTGLGVQQLSIAPPSIIPEIKKTVRSIDYEEATELAERVLNTEAPDEVSRLLDETNRRVLPEIVP